MRRHSKSKHPLTSGSSFAGKHVIVSGAGLAGTWLALALAQQNCKVTLLERRANFQSTNLFQGKSINLALSARGRAAFRVVGLEDQIVAGGCKMVGRFMHSADGESFTRQPYGQPHEYIVSVGREFMLKTMLDQLEKLPTVRILFQTKTLTVDFEKNTVHAERADGEKIEIQGDLIVGADGAYSKVRSCMARTKGFNFSQNYSNHGYKELTIPPTSDGNFAMAPDALHIWPRQEFMLIALPNPDRSFTVTLFMPWEGERGLRSLDEGTDDNLLKFFCDVFPDSVPLMPHLVKEFRENQSSYLVMIRCAPFYRRETVLIGDAAHAVVPFYGQGMNASLEDGRVLFELLQQYNFHIPKVLSEYNTLRKPDADAISDLSLYNYEEMRAHTASTAFLWRSALERSLNKYMPETFIPLYSMVSFHSEIRYSEAVRRNEAQKKTLDRVLKFGLPVAAIACVVGAVFGMKGRSIDLGRGADILSSRL